MNTLRSLHALQRRLHCDVQSPADNRVTEDIFSSQVAAKFTCPHTLMPAHPTNTHSHPASHPPTAAPSQPIRIKNPTAIRLIKTPKKEFEAHTEIENQSYFLFLMTAVFILRRLAHVSGKCIILSLFFWNTTLCFRWEVQIGSGELLASWQQRISCCTSTLPANLIS